MQPRLFRAIGLMRRTLVGRVLTLSLLSLGLAAAPITANADSTAFSGDAYVAKATLDSPVLGTVTVGPIADTGSLPESGGALENSLLTVDVTNPVDQSTLLTGEVGHTATIGQGDRSRSEASVASVNLNVAQQTVSADFLMSRATATCGPSATGSSELANLMVDGQPISVTGSPNQQVSLGGVGTVIINEQSSNASGNSSTMDVNALHVIVPGVADIIVAHAHADITCNGSPTCSGGDFVTGGGWIAKPDGSRANFAVAGGWKNGGWWGHLLYIDHGTGMKVQGTGVTFYGPSALGSTYREIDGNDEVNGSPNMYTVEVADNGEPGVNTDYFGISTAGYTYGAALSGGNIQLHQPCK